MVLSQFEMQHSVVFRRYTHDLVNHKGFLCNNHLKYILNNNKIYNIHMGCPN